MNETTPEDIQKTRVIKTLAIIGFVVALIFVAWLAVQAVRLVPAAFSTLASIADGLKNSKNSDFTIAAGANIINTGETLTISWTKPAQHGEYSFSYACTDGVVAEMPGATGTLSTIPCATEKPLGLNKNSVVVVFSSEKKRFVDVPYTISHTPAGTAVANKREGIITVVNQGINIGNVALDTHTTGISQSTSTSAYTNIPANPPAASPAASQTIVPTTKPPASTPKPVVPTPKPKIVYKTVPVVVTTYPVSKPNGVTDLAVTFIGVGTYDEATKNFSPQSFLTGSERAALRFEVKNIGSKTSGDWYFNASMPTAPVFTYSSPAQTALRPNERQVITLEFTAASRSVQTVTVAVTGGNDTNTTNNYFSKQISISN